MGSGVSWVILSLYHILIYVCQMFIGLRLLSPVVTLFNIVLYQRTGIVQDPDLVTISWIDSPEIITLWFLKSSVILLFHGLSG